MYSSSDYGGKECKQIYLHVILGDIQFSGVFVHSCLLMNSCTPPILILERNVASIFLCYELCLIELSCVTRATNLRLSINSHELRLFFFFLLRRPIVNFCPLAIILKSNASLFVPPSLSLTCEISSIINTRSSSSHSGQTSLNGHDRHIGSDVGTMKHHVTSSTTDVRSQGVDQRQSRCIVLNQYKAAYRCLIRE